MAAAGGRDGRGTVTAGDLKGGGESSLLERGLYERWIFATEALRGSLLVWIMGCDDTWGATVGVSGQDKSLSSKGKSWRSGMF